MTVIVKKTNDFDTLFEENEKKRTQYIEERNKVYPPGETINSK